MDEIYERIFEVQPTKPRCWTMVDVCEWLKLISMEQYAEQFKENIIDGYTIFELED